MKRDSGRVERVFAELSFGQDLHRTTVEELVRQLGEPAAIEEFPKHRPDGAAPDDVLYHYDRETKLLGAVRVGFRFSVPRGALGRIGLRLTISKPVDRLIELLGQPYAVLEIASGRELAYMLPRVDKFVVFVVQDDEVRAAWLGEHEPVPKAVAAAFAAAGVFPPRRDAPPPPVPPTER